MKKQSNNKNPKKVKSKQTPEQLKQAKRAIENFNFLCSLEFNSRGQLVTPVELQKELQLKEQQQEEAKRHQSERENVQYWQRLDFETLNTLIVQYKQTGEQTYFEQAWDKYLNELTATYLHKYVIKGLPQTAKRLFLCDHQSHELQDVLYEVLLKAIHSWSPDVPERFTRDFAAYYQQAVMNFTGNIINRFKQKKYKQVSIMHVDFSSEEEMNIVMQHEPYLLAHVKHGSRIDEVVWNECMGNFVKNELTIEQAKLFDYLVMQHLSVEQISKQLKIHRVSVYRKWKELKLKWVAYDLS